MTALDFKLKSGKFVEPVSLVRKILNIYSCGATAKVLTCMQNKNLISRLMKISIAGQDNCHEPSLPTFSHLMQIISIFSPFHHEIFCRIESAPS